MKEVIIKAIEGGYEPFKTIHMEYVNKSDVYGQEFVVESGAGIVCRKRFNDILLDPLFWQSLGKQQGWKLTDDCWGCGYDEGATSDTPIWKVNWHKFIDHIAEGKDTDSFFEELLK